MNQQLAIESWQAFHAGENPNTDSDQRWERWAKTAEHILALKDLDGTEDEGGYSIDGAYEAYKRGTSPDDYAIEVQLHPKFGTPTALEQRYVDHGYRLPQGWSWVTVAEHRRKWETNPIFMPLACAPGVVAWGVPHGADGKAMVHS